MPALIVSNHFSTDSRILRRTARALGWETLRLDALQIPDWFDPPDADLALYCTAPLAFDFAAQRSRTLLGCNPDWTIRLPPGFLSREIRQTTLDEALRLSGESFVKHAVSKAFPAGVYDARSLAEATAKVSRQALVHVGEPVTWTVEYRCFVVDRTVVTASPYQRHGEIIKHYADRLGAPRTEEDAAREFAQSVLACSAVDCPPALVLDVGIIEDRGWAFVEFNECWASGIYACDPAGVLRTLLRACPATDQMPADERRWGFQDHYFAACGRR